MGCDIHLYIEYSDKEQTPKEEIYWRDFGGRINPGRNYLLFGIMSRGVRTNPTFSFEQRGLPENLAFESRGDAQIFISDTPDSEYVTLEKAREWAKYGSKIINDDNGKPTWVENPDWHSHSWLTTAEYEQALKFYNENGEPKYAEPEYEAVLAAMKRLEEFGKKARVIFWFDN